MCVPKIKMTYCRVWKKKTKKTKGKQVSFLMVAMWYICNFHVYIICVFPYVLLYIKNRISMTLYQVRGCWPNNDVFSLSPSISACKKHQRSGLESLCQVSHICISVFAGILICCCHKGCCCYCIWIESTFESSSSFLFNLQWRISCRESCVLNFSWEPLGKAQPCRRFGGNLYSSFQSCLSEGSGPPLFLNLAAFPFGVEGKPLPSPLPFCLADWWLHDFLSAQDV